jgi:hypothetical protein
MVFHTIEKEGVDYSVYDKKGRKDRSRVKSTKYVDSEDDDSNLLPATKKKKMFKKKKAAGKKKTVNLKIKKKKETDLEYNDKYSEQLIKRRAMLAEIRGSPPAFTGNPFLFSYLPKPRQEMLMKRPGFSVETYNRESNLIYPSGYTKSALMKARAVVEKNSKKSD